MELKNFTNINQTTLTLSALLLPVEDTLPFINDFLRYTSDLKNRYDISCKYLSEFYNSEIKKILDNAGSIIEDAYNDYVSGIESSNKKSHQSRIFRKTVSKKLFNDSIFSNLPSLNNTELKKYGYFNDIVNLSALNHLCDNANNKKGYYKNYFDSIKSKFGYAEKSISDTILNNILIQDKNIKLYNEIASKLSEEFSTEINTLLRAATYVYSSEYQSLESIFNDNSKTHAFFIQDEIDFYNCIVNAGIEYNGEYIKSINVLIREYNQTQSKKSRLKLFDTLNNQIIFNRSSIERPTIYSFDTDRPNEFLHAYKDAMDKFNSLFEQFNACVIEPMKSVSPDNIFVNVNGVKTISRDLFDKIIDHFSYTKKSEKYKKNIDNIISNEGPVFSLSFLNSFGDFGQMNYFDNFIDTYDKFQMAFIDLMNLPEYKSKKKFNINEKYAIAIRRVNNAANEVKKYILPYLNIENFLQAEELKNFNILYNECRNALSKRTMVYKTHTANFFKDRATFNNSKVIENIDDSRIVPVKCGDDLHYMIINDTEIPKYIKNRYNDDSFIPSDDIEYYDVIGIISRQQKVTNECKINTLKSEGFHIDDITDMKNINLWYETDSYKKVLIEKSYIDDAVKDGRIYMFKCVRNRQTTPHKILLDYVFSDQNLYIDNKINIDKPSLRVVPKRADKKNSRYGRTFFKIDIPVTYNLYKLSQDEINQLVQDEMMDSPHDLHAIALDRGERNLLCMSVVNVRTNEIVEERSLNVINGVDYHNLIFNEDKSLKDHTTYNKEVQSRKNAKKKYVELAVNEVIKTFLKYKNSVIVLEYLNSGMKQSRRGTIGVYQDFEVSLVKRLSFYKDKHKHIDENGSVKNPCTFTYFDDVENIETAAKKRQNGVIFYVNAEYTSAIDPHTGFINTVKLEFESMKKSEKLVKTAIVEIKLTDDDCEITFDETKVKTKNSKHDNIKQRRNLYIKSNELRSRTVNVNNRFCYKEDKPHKILADIFKRCNIPNIVTGSEIVSIVNKDESLYKELFIAINMIRNIRNKIGDKDLICSPIKGKDGLRIQDMCELNGDTNGANNIAMKFISDIYRPMYEHYRTDSIERINFKSDFNRYIETIKEIELKRAC